MLEKISQFKKPITFAGAFIVMALGIVVLSSDSLKTGSKKDPSSEKEIPAAAKLSIGITLLVIGFLIVLTHWKDTK